MTYYATEVPAAGPPVGQMALLVDETAKIRRMSAGR